ncbi:MAG: DUF554 domain-containing protein [Clostridia bacterium]|nr:DUF554 domain-containing protein [Clostridia bacterium]
MLGLAVNVLAVVGCSLLGLLCKKIINDKIETVVMQALGVCVMVIGITDAINPVSGTAGILVLLISFAVGSIIGTLLNLEGLFDKAGNALQKAFSKKTEEGDNKFSEGFVQATMIFCIGAMGIYGSIEAGLGAHKTLLVKAVLDGTVALILTVKYGIGVLFSAIPVLLYQGVFVLLSGLIGPYLTSQLAFRQELSAIGGVFVFMVGINLVGIKKLHIANMLPAILGACYFLIF